LVLCIGIASAGLFFTSAVQATPVALPVLSLGSNTLLPNTANQTLQVFVNGSDTTIHADDFAAQVGDGGSANGGSNTGPKITALDLTTGTVFSAGSPFMAADGSLIAYGNVILPASTNVSDAGPVLLATLTLDTTGFSSGTFPLKFENVDQNHTGLGPLATDLVLADASALTPTGPGPGGSNTATITIVPEPATAGLALLCLGGALFYRRARKELN